MSASYRAICCYAAVNGAYGFYRGWNNLYNTPNFAEPYPLYTQRFFNGLGGVFIQQHPFFLIFSLQRAEKWARGMSITKEDYNF